MKTSAMGVGLPHKTLTLLWSSSSGMGRDHHIPCTTSLRAPAELRTKLVLGGWSWTGLQNIRKSELVMKGFVQTVWGPLRQIQDYQPANMEDRVQKQ